jgi:ankyrin repeat protein
MKRIFFIAGFMVVGLFLGFASYSKLSDEQAQSMLRNIDRMQSRSDSWEPTGPTAQDIRAATKVENLAAKGSLEDKLINAVKNGDLKNVETSIAAGASLEARDNENMTALMRAAEKGYSDIARILIDAGADISAKDKFDCTAFFKAADKKHVDIVKMLVAKGAATDSSFEGMLVSSVLTGNTEMVKALMVENARIKEKTLETAYMIALNNRRCNPEIFDVIAKALNKESEEL